ncbi:transglutaminase-like cysteine peptidase [Methylomarinum sp. Ch1-1]|uniref:Transglutaminase-like cysteine peptidase n=1 Tax=Methylomarinum roseum TaxID=3067653 RepID=A0AAU7NUQ2_9GAMM|nr:transglutaminase-like cysteine peptidase [Methylomarinum sp. Ch1-1]MDP4519216.1 transglutaminase-like cysteine peptidase [Methylomarinum sp. Ch1-1]
MPADNAFRRRSLRFFVWISGLLFAVCVSAELEISQALLRQIEIRFGQEAGTRITKWQTLLQSTKSLPEAEKLKHVNDFFNRQVEFVDDIYLWDQEDYWATPLEFLVRGAGDCEDYSIAKYFTLKELGVPESKMRITYVKAIELNQAHMVLTYFATPRSTPLVLDNLNPAIKPATQRRDLLPVYSFNGTGLWLAKSRGAGKRVGGSGRLSRWTSLKQRMLENSFGSAFMDRAPSLKNT